MIALQTRSALTCAASVGKVAAVEYLIAHGAIVDTRDSVRCLRQRRLDLLADALAVIALGRLVELPS